MKKVILVGDGMGDYPVESLGGKTPLQAANPSHMRRIAAAGDLYMVQTVPDSLPPGSDVANLGLLGYNAEDNYTGRAPIEAAGAGLHLSADTVALRCNLVTVENGIMQDYSAGHISTEEAHSLIDSLQSELGREGLQFHGGVSYRHLLLWENGPVDLQTEPPHEISDREIAPYLPQGIREAELRELMEQSKAIFADHPVNRDRIRRGKAPATQIWLWGQGRALRLQSYADRYGLSGGIISAVDLVRGLGILAGLQAPVIPGATGEIDTNYEGKVAKALEILEDHDFAYLHIEAPDECGHMGDAALKTEAIRRFDQRVVGPMWEALEKRGEPYRIILAMDHRTPVSLKGHSREPVPIAVLDGPTGPLQPEADFDETVNGGQGNAVSYQLIQQLLA